MHCHVAMYVECKRIQQRCSYRKSEESLTALIIIIKKYPTNSTLKLQERMQWTVGTSRSLPEPYQGSKNDVAI